MEEINWEDIYKGFWVMVGMVSVNAPVGTDLSVVSESIDTLLKEKIKEQWNKN